MIKKQAFSLPHSGTFPTILFIYQSIHPLISIGVFQNTALLLPGCTDNRPGYRLMQVLIVVQLSLHRVQNSGIVH